MYSDLVLIHILLLPVLQHRSNTNKCYIYCTMCIHMDLGFGTGVTQTLCVWQRERDWGVWNKSVLCTHNIFVDRFKTVIMSYKKRNQLLYVTEKREREKKDHWKWFKWWESFGQKPTSNSRSVTPYTGAYTLRLFVSGIHFGNRKAKQSNKNCWKISFRPSLSCQCIIEWLFGENKMSTWCCCWVLSRFADDGMTLS